MELSETLFSISLVAADFVTYDPCVRCRVFPDSLLSEKCHHMTIYTWVQKFGIPFHYPSQAPLVLLIVKSVFVTFLLVPLKQTEVYCILLLPPSPKLFQSMTISWGDLLVQPALAFWGLLTSHCLDPSILPIL